MSATQQKTEPEAVTFRFTGDTIAVPFRVQVRPGEFLVGTVRPPVPKELTAYFKKLKAAGDEPDAVRAEFYARHIVSWNHERPPTADVFLTLPGVLFNAVDAVVLDAEGAELVLGKPDA